MTRLRFAIRAGIAAVTFAVALGPAAAQEGKGKRGEAAKAGKQAKPEAANEKKAADKTPSISIDVAAVRADLFSTDPDRAAAAAEKLGASRQAGALDALLDALALGLHPRAAQAALDAVARHRSPAALEVLLAYASHRQPEVRARAVLALGALDDPRARAAARAALVDGEATVRAAGCRVVAERKDAVAADTLLALLKKGDEAVPPAIAALATPELARRVAELVGEAPDALVAESLGLMLLRPDLGKEDVYVEIVRALGKVPGEEAIVNLTNFLSATPETPARQSRREAQAVVEQRLGGGD